MKRNQSLPTFLFLLISAHWVSAQNAVNVTIAAGDATLAVGETTTITVFGQVASPQDGDSLKIFSWHLDILTTPDDASILNVNWNSLLMPESDSPDGSASTAGTGTTDGANNRRGIYNTFLNPTTSQSGIPNPGIGAPVILMTFDVTATGPGVHTFTVGAGTIQPLSDFLVLRNGGAGAYTGGNYNAATVSITVEAPAEPNLEAIDFRISEVTGSIVTLSFNPEAGFDHIVRYKNELTDPAWTPLPGAPHNGGTLIDDIGLLNRRFYHLEASPTTP
ncbi:MAG: hypothetical protein ACFCU4_05615 [Puniceicoccaceae bacterium]